MSWPKGYWLWASWLLFLIVSFAILETIALETGTPTLSRSVWTWTQNWPELPFVAGLIAGFLACHFWWGGIVSFAPVSSIFRRKTK
jgi:hypothetical protein